MALADIAGLRSIGPNASGLLAEAAALDIDVEPESGGEKQEAAAVAKGRAQNVEEVKSRLTIGANRTDEGWFSLRAPTKAHRKVTSKTRQKGAMEWDVFLSYRQAADEDLVKEV